MKNILFYLSVLGLTLTATAKADIIVCGFTEPFVTSIYSTTQSTLTYKEYNGKVIKTLKNISFQIKSAGVFELVAKNGTVIQTLLLNNEGSDESAEFTYPYQVKDTTDLLRPTMGNGSCTSNKLPRFPISK